MSKGGSNGEMMFTGPITVRNKGGQWGLNNLGVDKIWKRTHISLYFWCSERMSLSSFVNLYLHLQTVWIKIGPQWTGKNVKKVN